MLFDLLKAFDSAMNEGRTEEYRFHRRGPGSKDSNLGGTMVYSIK